MGKSRKDIFRQYFWLNPVFFLELSRIECGLARCVIPQQVFQVNPVTLEELNFTYRCFLNEEIDVSELFHRSEVLEKRLAEEIAEDNIASVAKEMGFKIQPTIIFVNRILSHPVLSPDVQFYVAKEFDKQRIKNVEKKILSGKMEREKGRERLIVLEGRMLGYPDCCISGYLEGKKGLPAESRIITECVECGTFRLLLDSIVRSEIISFPQFFTSNFYPCSIECEQAIEVGRSIESWLESKEYIDAFRIRTMANALYLLVTAHKASKTEGGFGKRLQEYFSSLSAQEVEIVKAAENVIINITPFTNILISRIVGGLSEKEKSAENQKN
ncbi:DUF483 domain-containing protein [Archaeoglobus neptunius]|uniref:DUF483 domain-containing protein n=1 Tax=Archaeoglobus neptunius TaxID=2798580 RepID=UPI0019254392|nr:DUF483 domain-containing protein [Archaeoglobus neptunius]